MRRGTTAAIEFGKLLYTLRTNANMSTRQVGEKIGSPHSTVSQIEKGERALKEPKIAVWANALGVQETYLRTQWHRAQNVETPPITHRRTKSLNQTELRHLVLQLTATERDRVRGYIEALIDNRKNN